MLLRFIGTDGSMGLKKGQVYIVRISTTLEHIIVKWTGVDSCGSCPYSSPQTFAANWE